MTWLLQFVHRRSIRRGHGRFHLYQMSLSHADIGQSPEAKPSQVFQKWELKWSLREAWSSAVPIFFVKFNAKICTFWLIKDNCFELSNTATNLQYIYDDCPYPIFRQFCTYPTSDPGDKSATRSIAIYCTVTNYQTSLYISFCWHTTHLGLHINSCVAVVVRLTEWVVLRRVKSFQRHTDKSRLYSSFHWSQRLHGRHNVWSKYII